MEMLVTVAVLALMVGAFGTILTEAQDLVVTSQAIMKANARATSLAGIIRDDISRASKLGFLHIDRQTNNANRLIVAIPGNFHSLTSRATGTGAFIQYGRVAADDVVYRSTWILAGKTDAELAAMNPQPADVFWPSGQPSPDFVDIQSATDDDIYKVADSTGYVPNIKYLAPPSVNTSPATLSDVNALWDLLSENCSEFNVEALDANLGSIVAVGDTGTWTKSGGIEASLPDDWPAAIKITITLTDPEILDRADATTAGEFKYEIICPVRP